MEDNKSKKYFLSFIWIFFFILYFFIFYSMNVRKPVGDYLLHNSFSLLMFDGEMQIMYPGYHLLVGGIALLLHASTALVSSVILSIASLLSIYVTQKIIERFDLCFGRIELLFAAFIVNFVQPVFTFANRPGASSGNGYISPTHILCKPFIFLTVYFFFIQYRENKWTIRNQGLLLGALILSCIVKPIFAMAFVPAEGILLFIAELKEYRQKGFWKSLKSYLNRVWPLFFTGLFLLGQYFYMKTIVISDGMVAGGTDGSAKICFGFLYAWKMHVQNVGISIIYAYFTPIITCIYVFVKKIELSTNIWKYLKMNFLYGIVSFFYISCLYQDKYASDLNFRNGWIANYLMVYVINIVIIKKIYMKHRSMKEMLPLIIPLGIQMLFGILLYLKYII